MEIANIFSSQGKLQAYKQIFHHAVKNNENISSYNALSGIFLGFRPRVWQS